jgi:transcription factor C subunit 3
MAMSTIGMRQFGRANAGIDFSYISSEVESGDEDMAGNNEEDFSVLHKRKRDLSDCYETGKNIEDSGSGKRKRRRLTGQYSRMEYSQSSSNALRQISTMMDPDHSVHAPTGTFSVTFSGFKSTSVEAIRPRGTKLLSEVTTDFEKEVDDLLRWELETYDFADSVFPDWPFINYKILHPHLTPAETEYAIGPNFAIKFYQRRKPYASSSTKKVTILEKIPEGETDLQLHKKSHKRKRRDPVLKTRRLTSLSQAHASAGFGTSETSKRGPRPQKLRKVRGPQKQHPMTRDEEERLLAAVVAIRTITGGIDKNPDWVLISRLFQPSFSQMYIQKRWAQVLQRNRLQMDQIQANFQTKFAKAYEENIIPTINFDHLEDYDWEWLVEWTLDNIDTSWDSLQYLPSKRSELDLLFEITASTEVDMSEYFEINSSVTLQRREAVLNKSPYVYPTDHSRQPTANARSQEVAIAKTWIRANVITAAASYNSDLARAKLSAISESSVDLALQELLSARLLSQSNKGRLVPGRNYDISDYFLSRFRKKFDTAQFRRAVSFKRRLDDKFDEESSVLIPYEASNGDILATLNMLAFGRITVRAKNPPMKKFGLTDGGYRTRLMDKSRLNFDVEIHRTATYITGNPISPLPSPPCQHLNDPMAKIPLWYDIHGEFVLVMWDMLLAATMSILNMRLSVTAAEIAHSLRPSTETWEIELLLEWMVRAGAATKTEEGGYTMTEWWWMCLDNNNEELVISPGGNAGAK